MYEGRDVGNQRVDLGDDRRYGAGGDGNERGNDDQIDEYKGHNARDRDSLGDEVDQWFNQVSQNNCENEGW